MENLSHILEGIGLSENEAKIYLALLELGKSGITDISNKSGIKRTTIYSYINPLLEKSFIKRTIYGKRTYFTSEKPSIIVKAVEEKKKAFLEKVPLLEVMYNKKSPNPRLEFYEGKIQIKEMYRKIEKSGEKVVAFFSPKEFNNLLGEEFEEELSILSNIHGTTIKNLLRNDTYGKNHLKNSHTSNSSKLLPEDFEIEVDINIVKNTTILVSYEPVQAILIKNKAFSDFLRNLHNYFWKTL